MNTGIIIAIGFFAFAVIIVAIAVAWVLLNKRREGRHLDAGKIRDQAREEAFHVSQREALAEQAAGQADDARPKPRRPGS